MKATRLLLNPRRPRCSGARLRSVNISSQPERVRIKNTSALPVRPVRGLGDYTDAATGHRDEAPRHHDRQSLLRSTPIDPQCTAFPPSTSFAAPYSRLRDQQGRLLQLRTRRYFWSSYGQVAVYPERRNSASFLDEEVRARSATAS